MINIRNDVFIEQQRFISKKRGLVVCLTALAVLLFSMASRYMKGAEMIGPVILVLIAYLFFELELTVVVKNTELLISFPPLLKRILLLSDSIHCETREYNPIREFGGWGIRRSWKGKGRAYNYKGNKGVQVELQNGESLLIGSQKAERLAEAVKEG